jgi:hypothetical protein
LCRIVRTKCFDVVRAVLKNQFVSADLSEMEKLRQLVVTEIRTNQQLEGDLNQMDIKIGLLVKNRITLQVSLSEKCCDRITMDGIGPSLSRQFIYTDNGFIERYVLIFVQVYFWAVSLLPELEVV